MSVLKYVTGGADTDQVMGQEVLNRALARAAAQEGIVLLKNDGALPLAPGKIAVYGAGAARTIKGGSGSGEVNERYTVTILEGLKAAGFTVTTQRWIDDYEKTFADAKAAYAQTVKFRLTNLSDIINAMSNPMLYPTGRAVTDEDIAESDTDTAIYIVARQAGEGADKKLEKGEFDLQSEEKESLRKIASAYEKSILVINSGAQMDLSILDEIDLSAVIYFCQQGEEGGNAFADILTGAVSPSGKLTDSWAMKYADLPFGDQYSYLSGDTTKEYYKEGIYVGYRYFDTFGVPVRFPFGYGLSYTTFRITPQETVLSDGVLHLDVCVENTGTHAGKEVVQVYAAMPGGECGQEAKRLTAFAKTEPLDPGELQVLQIKMPTEYLKSYDEKIAAWVIEAGDYVISVGNGIGDLIPAAVIGVGGRQVLSYVKNVCRIEEEICELAAPKREAVQVPAGLPRFGIGEIVPKKTDYTAPSPVDREDVAEILEQLTDEELSKVVTGGGIGSMTKANKITAPSAAGKTTDDLYEKGLIGVNLSDGPAGLRISKSFTVQKNGSIKGGELIMEFMEFMPAFLKKQILADPQKDKLLYQFCTAFPVGTSLAQSWNETLCACVGAAVAAEMNEYHITYWLAPAMNIHRNPLCGRNFEYFSEDPVLSGKVSAAIVRGVQSVPGAYATIKHFAANNQEDNRNHSDSILDERTLREIYLRGFEICVKEAKPEAIMSSYNLINGTYSPNCKDLLTDVLRNEWGFDGIVMTDWFSTGSGLGRNDLAIAAGNDLIMPGGGSNRKEILKGLKKGTLTRDELVTCASRIVREILDSNMAMRYHPDQFVEPAGASDITDLVNIRRKSFICHRGMLKIKGTYFYPEDGENLPIAIVSHGFMSNRRSCYAYAKTLAQCGYAAFTFDFCGGGVICQSQGSTWEMSVLTEVKDLEAVITYARRQPIVNPERLLLMGCSQGGFVSALTAAQNPDEVDGLILLFPALSIPDDARKGSMMQAKFDPADIPEKIDCGPMKLGRQYAADVIDMDPYAEITPYKGMVLLVHGDADRVVDVSYSKKAAAAYQAAGADVRLKIMPDADHGFTNPLQDRKVRSLVGTFARHILKNR